MRFFRSMLEASDSHPLVGASGRMLGVRPGTSPTPDVFASAPSDLVLPGQGGMSVAPSDPTHLPRHRRPASLGGTGGDPVWYIEEEDLGLELQIRQDRPTHAFIEPKRPLTLQEYLNALAGTRLHWKLYSR